MLGEVIVDHQHIFTLLHKVFAHGAAAVRRDVLQGGKLRSGGGNNDGIVHRAAGGKGFHHLGHGRALLPDGDIDTDDAVALLVQDGIQRDGGLAGLAVTDDELTLAAANGDHAVDGLDTGLKRHGNGLTLDDAGRGAFHRGIAGGFHRAFAIDGRTEGIDDTADEGFAHRDRHNTAGAADGIAFLDAAVIAQNDDSDGIFL